jgi:hypothetical protein
VTVFFDAGQIREADRAEAVCAAVAKHFVPVEIDFAADRGPAAAHLAVTDSCDFTVCSVTSNAVRVHRTAALARDDLTSCRIVTVSRLGNRPEGRRRWGPHRPCHN